MYEMKPEYYIGIDMIDEEHKQLFKYADEAYELLHDEFTPDKYDKMDIILEKLRDYAIFFYKITDRMSPPAVAAHILPVSYAARLRFCTKLCLKGFYA